MEELLNDKIGRFELKMWKLFEKYHLDIEQITLDFLEEIDYKIGIMRKNVFDTEVLFLEIVGRARSFDKSYLMEKDVELLNIISNLIYPEL